jgi:hypothetical protein
MQIAASMPRPWIVAHARKCSKTSGFRRVRIEDEPAGASFILVTKRERSRARARADGLVGSRIRYRSFARTRNVTVMANKKSTGQMVDEVQSDVAQAVKAIKPVMKVAKKVVKKVRAAIKGTKKPKAAAKKVAKKAKTVAKKVAKKAKKKAKK